MNDWFCRSAIGEAYQLVKSSKDEDGNNQVKEIITAANIDLQGRFSVFNVDNRNYIEDLNKLLTKVKGEKFTKFINL